MEMRIVSWICFAIALAPAVPSIFGAEKPETSRLAFVAEYIRELAAIQNIRTFVGHEIRQGKEAEKSAVVADVLYAGTLVQLELRSQIARLESMRLNPPFDDLIPKLTAVYRLKVHWCQKLIDNGNTVISTVRAGPKPGADYEKLEKLDAEFRKITAKLEAIDHILEHFSPLVFYILMAEKEDSKHHQAI